MSRISIIGDLFCDILASTQNLPTWGTDTLASGIQLLPGGSAFNSAVHASKYIGLKEYPIKISLFGAVGNDMFSGIMKKAIHDNDIEDHVVVRSGARTGSCIVMSSNNDRCFITDRGVVDMMMLEWFEEDDIIPLETSHLHVGGYYNLGMLKAELESLLKRALSLGIHTSLNPQYDATEKWDGIESLAPFLSILILSEMELFAITKGESVTAAASMILDWGCKIVVVTLGPKGAVAYTKEEVFEQNTLIVEVVDTTGAGDAFVGGFITEYSQTKNVQASLLAGCTIAVAAITVIGGSSSLPARALSEFFDRLSHTSNPQGL